MKILVVRFKQIGDAILSSVICKTLKETYPEAEIDYVLYDYAGELFEHQSYINEVISLSESERKNPFKYIKKAWQVTRKKYDIVIDIMSTPKSEVFTLFSRGAKYRIGRYKPKRGYTYTHSIPEPSSELYDKPEKFLKMLEPLEKDGINVKYNKNYSIEFLDLEIEKMRKRMIEAGIDFNKIIIPVAINSRRAHKVYPIDYMRETIKKILERYDCQIILYYSPEEKSFAKEFHESLNWDKRIISDIKTDNIRDLGAMFKSCDMFFGNEGGPRHLAQACGLMSFAIFNPITDKKDWLLKNVKEHEAIQPSDILPKKELEKMTREEQYRVITPNILLEKIDEKIQLIPKYQNMIKK